MARTGSDRLLSLSEGFVKVRCAEVALDLGWVLQEGVGNQGIADFAEMSDGKLIWTRGARRLYAVEGSADLAIVSPFALLLEIKARPDFGTKSQAQFGQMEEDISRVAATETCVMFAVFDSKMYRSFSAEKVEGRGRRALAADWFYANFPKISDIGEEGWRQVQAERDGAQLSLLFRKYPRETNNGAIIFLACQSGASEKVLSPALSISDFDDMEI